MWARSQLPLSTFSLCWPVSLPTDGRIRKATRKSCRTGFLFGFAHMETRGPGNVSSITRLYQDNQNAKPCCSCFVITSIAEFFQHNPFPHLPAISLQTCTGIPPILSAPAKENLHSYYRLVIDKSLFIVRLFVNVSIDCINLFAD